MFDVSLINFTERIIENFFWFLFSSILQNQGEIFVKSSLNKDIERKFDQTKCRWEKRKTNRNRRGKNAGSNKVRRWCAFNRRIKNGGEFVSQFYLALIRTSRKKRRKKNFSKMKNEKREKEKEEKGRWSNGDFHHLHFEFVQFIWWIQRKSLNKLGSFESTKSKKEQSLRSVSSIKIETGKKTTFDSPRTFFASPHWKSKHDCIETWWKSTNDRCKKREFISNLNHLLLDAFSFIGETCCFWKGTFSFINARSISLLLLARSFACSELQSDSKTLPDLSSDIRNNLRCKITEKSFPDDVRMKKSTDFHSTTMFFFLRFSTRKQIENSTLEKCFSRFFFQINFLELSRKKTNRTSDRLCQQIQRILVRIETKYNDWCFLRGSDVKVLFPI